MVAFLKMENWRMKQIVFNSLTMGGGKTISPCVTSHYHKVGWKDILEANQIPHFGIIAIDNANSNQSHRRPPMPDTASECVCESETAILSGSRQSLELSCNNSNKI